jgi:hypothetical protein
MPAARTSKKKMSANAIAKTTRPPASHPPLATLPTRLSASSLACYQLCPAQYRFGRVDHLPEQTSGHQLWAGSLTHAAVQFAYALPYQSKHWRTQWRLRPPGQLGEPPQVLALFDALWQNDPGLLPLFDEASQAAYDLLAATLQRPPEREFGQGYSSGLGRRLAGSQDWHQHFRLALVDLLAKLPPHPALAIEAEINVEIGGVPFIGFVDLLLTTADGTWVVDLKTGAKRPSRSALAEHQQFAIYRAALQPAAVMYWYFWENELIEVPLVAGSDERLANAAQTAWSAINARRFEPRYGSHCHWCSFRNHCQRLHGQIPA